MTDNERQFAIMFSDVSGSTRLYETLGDARAREAIATCVDSMSEAVRLQQGVVIKTIGDEVMSRFDEAEHAIVAACAIQETMETGLVPDVALAVRIGIHWGPAILEGDDVFGDAVNVAARMAGIAKARQIITTADTVAALPPELKDSTRIFDRAPVKGKQAEMLIHEVLWEAGGDVTRMATLGDNPVLQEALPPLTLTYHGDETTIPVDSPAFVLGRGDQCDLRIATSLASRSHARIEYRRGEFILVDQSTNGTYVRTQDGEMVYLRREELPLWGTGVISLGRVIEEGDPDLVQFNT